MIKVEIINLKLHENYTLDLVGMGSAGYSWVYNVDNENILAISHRYLVPTNPEPGGRVTERFTISGIQRGSSVIEFRQIRKWEKDQPPLSVRKFQINVI